MSTINKELDHEVAALLDQKRESTVVRMDVSEIPLHYQTLYLPTVQSVVRGKKLRHVPTCAKFGQGQQIGSLVIFWTGEPFDDFDEAMESAVFKAGRFATAEYADSIGKKIRA